MAKRSTIGESPMKRSNPLDKIIPGGLPKKAVLPPAANKQAKKPRTTIKVRQDLMDKANALVAENPSQTMDQLISDALSAHLKKLQKGKKKKNKRKE